MNRYFLSSRSSFALFCYRALALFSFSVIYHSLSLPGSRVFLLLGHLSLSFVTGLSLFPPSRSSITLFRYRSLLFSSFSVTNHPFSLPDTHDFPLLGHLSLSFVTWFTHFPPSQDSHTLFGYPLIDFTLLLYSNNV